MIQNAKQGYHNGGIPPYGYSVGKIKDSKGREKSVWVLGPSEDVANVRRIFDLYVRHNKGYKVIVNILNMEGVPSTRWQEMGLYHSLLDFTQRRLYWTQNLEPLRL